MDYHDFLASKQLAAKPSGFAVDRDKLNPSLFPFQADIVQWALKLGRAACFAECGMGKTICQLEWARLVAERTDGGVLILTPLAVAQQTAKEAERFGIKAKVVSSQDECDVPICITNYQKLHHFDPTWFKGIVLDESSILKSYMGKTKQALLTAFADTPFRLCCTATPAPNDYLELGNHSAFLGVMESDEMISRWFINDTMEAGKYRLKAHGAKDYWNWVATWAVCVSKPSDLGYSDDGFVLPPLEYHEVVVEDGTVHQSAEVSETFWDDTGLSSTNMHQTMRRTAGARAQAAADLVNASSEPWVVWCNTNYEADELVKRIPGAVEVRGSDTDDRKERKLNGFTNGEFRVIVTKPSLAGFGLNWQHCPNTVFVGLSYSFEQYYQAVRRVWRFGQRNPVNAYIVTANSEGPVCKAVQVKQRGFERMRDELVEATRAVGVSGDGGFRNLKAVATDVADGSSWQVNLGDSVEWLKERPDNSIDYTLFSPPFSSLYIYSDALADMGNCGSDEEFFNHFGYMVEDLFRVTVPGRLCSIHVKDLPLYRGRDGAAGLKDFPGACIRLFEEKGWTYHSRVTVWKDPVIEMQRTKNQGLLYKQLRKDSCHSRQGMADYVLTFRAWKGDASNWPKPVEHTKESFSLDQWQQWASPVWMDIQQPNVLNHRLGKAGGDEKHICPLQLDLIERCIKLWSNPGDLVLDPFTGIGSTGFVAIKTGRRFVGVELKRSYFDQAVKNLRAAEDEAKQPKLFSEAA